jgi:small conductance mechanosensitive channel
MDEHLQAMEQVQRTAVDLAVNFGPRLLVAVLILGAGVVVSRWVGRVIEPALGRFELEPPVRDLLARVVRILVMGLFLVMALQNLGVELLPLIAGLGIAGAGVALALQGVLGNLAAGLTIIFTRPFRVGEYVSIVGVEGRVDAIGLFNTTLSHSDLSQVVVPNRKIAGEILHNYGKVRQLSIVVGVAYDTDLNRVFAVIRELLQADPRVLKSPEPSVGITTLGESAINIHVEPWTAVADYWTASEDIQKGIVELFREHRIVIPFPQREVRSVGTAA